MSKFLRHESESEVAQSRPTLSDPMNCSPPGSSIHGIFQQEYYTCTHLLSKKLLYLLNLSLSPQNLVSIPLGEQKNNLFLCAKFRPWINSSCLLHFSKCFLDGFIGFSVKTNSTETRLLSYPRPEFCDPDIGAQFHIWPKRNRARERQENTRHKMHSCEVCVRN